MPYTILKTNGTQLSTVVDGTVDNTSSLTLVGKNYAGYGSILNENFVYVLENFANSTPPTNPIVGQIWWDSADKILKVFANPTTGSTSYWKSMSSLITSPTTPATPITPVIGDFWWNSTGNQLNVYTGSAWQLIGPTYQAAQGKTGIFSATVYDNNLPPLPHTVSELWVGGNIVAILSNDPAFTLATNSITNFVTINPGLNLQNPSPGLTPALTGTSTDALSLGGVDSSHYVRNDIANQTVIAPPTLPLGIATKHYVDIVSANVATLTANLSNYVTITQGNNWYAPAAGGGYLTQTIADGLYAPIAGGTGYLTSTTGVTSITQGSGIQIISSTGTGSGAITISATGGGGGGGGGTSVRETYTNVSGGTPQAFTMPSPYVVGYLNVFRNGVKIEDADFTPTGVSGSPEMATGFTTITAAGDTIFAECVTAAQGAQGPQGLPGVSGAAASTGTIPATQLLAGNGTGGFSAVSLATTLVLSGGTLGVSTTVPVTLASNLVNVGTTGAIPYVSGVNTTGFTDAGSTGWLLTSTGGSAPAWSNPATLTVGSANSATVATSATTASTAVTQAPHNNSTSIATTAYTDAADNLLLDIPSNHQTAAYTLALSDRGKSIDTTATVNIPTNAVVAFPVGAILSITNVGGAAISIIPTAGVTLYMAGVGTGGTRTLSTYGWATLRQVTANTWYISGSGLL